MGMKDMKYDLFAIPHIYIIMDKFGMYKKIPASAPASEETLTDAQNYTAAPEYATAKGMSGAEKNRENGTDGKTPGEIGRIVAAAGTRPEPAEQPSAAQKRRPLSASQLAYLEMQQKHRRLSEEIDKRNKIN